MEVKDLAGLSKPLEKLIDVCSSGLGKVTEPRLIRKKAEAKAYEIEIMTQALLESKKKLGSDTTYENEGIKLVVNKSDPEIEEVEIIKDSEDEIKTFNNDMEERLYFKNLKKEKNIYNTINFTMNEMNEMSEEEISDEKIDEDWITRFFNTIEDINNEQLQMLWGKILAGETKQPNTYSLRTLELLKNLSFREAELFSKVGNFSIQNTSKDLTFILSNKQLLNKLSISFSDIMLLQELDLLHSKELQFEFDAPHQEDSFGILIYGREIVKIEIKKHIAIKLKVYYFSKIGKELLNLVKQTSNISYKQELVKQIKIQSKAKVYSTFSLDDKGSYNPLSFTEIK